MNQPWQQAQLSSCCFASCIQKYFTDEKFFFQGEEDEDVENLLSR